MPDSKSKDLILVEELLNEAKIIQALELIEKFERSQEIKPIDQLSIFISRGKICFFEQELMEAAEFGNQAYVLSQKIGLEYEAIEALLLQSWEIISWQVINDPEHALNFILEVETRLNSLSERSNRDLSILRLEILYRKTIIYRNKGDFIKAFELASEGLALGKKIQKKFYIGRFLNVFGLIFFDKSEQDPALEYTMKALEIFKHLECRKCFGRILSRIGFIHHLISEYDTAIKYYMEALEIFKQIEFQVGIAQIFTRLAWIYYLKGDLNQASKFTEKSMSIKEIGENIIVENKVILGGIYREKGDLNKSLDYYLQSLDYANKNKLPFWIAAIQTNLGVICRLKGETSKAVEYFKRSLAYFDKVQIPSPTGQPMFNPLYLLSISLDENSYEEAQLYLKHLKELNKQINLKFVKQAYQIGKALLLKASSRMQDHVGAANILKQIMKDEVVYIRFHVLAIITLFDLLLKELSYNNNPEIFNEITPLLNQLLKLAEENQSYSLLSEALLQGRVALIKLNLDDARKYLTKAQQIADEHDLTLLARKISFEHDKLVDELETWQNFKKTQVSMSKRIEFASIDGVIDRMQEKRAIDPPELVDEQATLLLIIAEGGVLIFSHPFTDEWKQDDSLFSSFLSAFTSFSDDFLSEGLDRVKFEQHTVLMESIGSFSVCYLYRGQTYTAKQKLSKFSQQLQNNTSIWPILEKYQKTSQTLEIKDSPFLEHLITNIFIT
ncbi:MAG: tetratricopeptide repeat protein [Promethearchaeota archaeon]|jgi:tetratricopeptide (TPR) repeat protein